DKRTSEQVAMARDMPCVRKLARCTLICKFLYAEVEVVTGGPSSSRAAHVCDSARGHKAILIGAIHNCSAQTVALGETRASEYRTGDLHQVKNGLLSGNTHQLRGGSLSCLTRKMTLRR